MYLVNVHGREQDVASTLYYGVYFIFSNVMFLNIAILAGYCSRFPAFERELKAAMYGPTMYWLVSTALSILVDMIAAVASAVPISLFMNVPASSYFGIICLSFACFSFLTAAIEWFALSGRESATFFCAQLGCHMSFGANAYLNAKEIIWPFRIFYYILPSHYFFDSALQLSFGDENAHWNGAYRVSSAHESILNSSAGREALQSGDTFVCPETPGNCYGDNGRDVLASLASIHEAAGARPVWGENFLVIMAMTLAFRLFGALALNMRIFAQQKYTVGTGKFAPGASERSALLAGGSSK